MAGQANLSLEVVVTAWAWAQALAFHVASFSMALMNDSTVLKHHCW